MKRILLASFALAILATSLAAQPRQSTTIHLTPNIYQPCGGHCNPTAPPPPPPQFFPPVPYDINPVQNFTQSAHTCYFVVVSGNVVCFDDRLNQIFNLPTYSSYAHLGFAIPLPKHPGCFITGLVGGQVAAGAAAWYSRMLRAGKVVRTPYAQLTVAAASGLYTAYNGC